MAEHREKAAQNPRRGWLETQSQATFGDGRRRGIRQRLVVVRDVLSADQIPVHQPLADDAVDRETEAVGVFSISPDNFPPGSSCMASLIRRSMNQAVLCVTPVAR